VIFSLGNKLVLQKLKHIDFNLNIQPNHSIIIIVFEQKLNGSVFYCFKQNR